MSDLVNVGDVIICKTDFGTKKYPVTRVTKTLAMSIRDDGFEYRFKRKISSNMAHPYVEWSRNRYSVERGES